MGRVPVMVMFGIVFGRAGVGLEISVQACVMLGIAPAAARRSLELLFGLGCGFFFVENIFFEFSEFFHCLSPFITPNR